LFTLCFYSIEIGKKFIPALDNVDPVVCFVDLTALPVLFFPFCFFENGQNVFEKPVYYLSKQN
jgi:hypothetical protein